MTTVMSTRIAAGQTKPGVGWQQHNDGVWLDVDTSSAKFQTTPIYTVTLGGAANMWSASGGSSAVYSPTPTGFTVYIRHMDGSSRLDANKVNSEYKWYVNWIAIEGTPVEDCYDAAIPTGYVKVISKLSGKAMNVQGNATANGAAIIQYGPSAADAENELFQFERLDCGFYKITAKNGKVLDVTAGADIFKDSTTLRLWDWCNTDNQKFRVESLGDGHFRIIAKHSYKAVTVELQSKADGAALLQWPWNDGDGQKWRIG